VEKFFGKNSDFSARGKGKLHPDGWSLALESLR